MKYWGFKNIEFIFFLNLNSPSGLFNFTGWKKCLISNKCQQNLCTYLKCLWNFPLNCLLSSMSVKFPVSDLYGWAQTCPRKDIPRYILYKHFKPRNMLKKTFQGGFSESCTEDLGLRYTWDFLVRFASEMTLWNCCLDATLSHCPLLTRVPKVRQQGFPQVTSCWMHSSSLTLRHT